MRIIRCKPGEAPEICEIDNTLEALQAEVGGYIEHVQLAPGVGLLCCGSWKNVEAGGCELPGAQPLSHRLRRRQLPLKGEPRDKEGMVL